jgi:DNA polymerase/3'-5' exonuclease PolX
MSVNILAAFNDHFVDFVTDIHNVFPDDVDVLTAKNSLLTIRKLNPKMIVKIWNTFIVGKYKKEIEDGELSFFIDKDYTDDVSSVQNSDKIVESINRLRNPVKQMSIQNQTKVMKYIQNLTKLSAMCENI